MGHSASSLTFPARSRDFRFSPEADIRLCRNFNAAARCASGRDDPSVRDDRQRTVIVAVIAVRMMEASVDQVIKVVPVRNHLMAAARTMAMRRIVSGSTMLRVAPIGIRGTNFNHVFISAPLFHMLQVAMVEIINVILMLNGNMAAARTMHMRLIGRGHDASLSECRISLASKIGNDSDEIADARNSPSRGI